MGVNVNISDFENVIYKNELFTFYYGDISNKYIWDDLKQFCVDKVIHLAAQAGVRYSIINPDAYVQSNVIGFQNLLEFCCSQSINGILYASSSSVYGKDSEQPFSETESCNHPESFYAATKKFNEASAYSYFKTKNLSSIGLRFFTVYGPWGRPDMAPMIFADLARRGKKIPVFNYGNQKRDFTFVDDIVQAIVLLFEKMLSVKMEGADVINIGRGEPIGLNDFIDLLEKYFNKKIMRDYIEAQPGDVSITFADTKKLFNYISYFPYTPLQEGLEKFCEWHKSYFNSL